MPKIIVTSRYMKSGAHAHVGNYVKYIGTREGVAVPENNMGITKSQTKLIENLIKDFPQTKNLPEYKKYIAEPNAKTASECISAVIDENLDLLASREIYMNYLGTRPNVVAYSISEKSTRKVQYADKGELEREILRKYPPKPQPISAMPIEMLDEDFVEDKSSRKKIPRTKKDKIDVD